MKPVHAMDRRRDGSGFGGSRGQDGVKAMEFKKGDIVQLKSGGPAMVVTGEAGEGVQVLWYGEIVDEIKTGTVPAICLVEAELEEAEDEAFGRR